MSRSQQSVSLCLVWSSESGKPIQASISITLLNHLTPQKNIVRKFSCVFIPAGDKVGFENFVKLDTMMSATSGFVVKDTATIQLRVRARHPEIIGSAGSAYRIGSFEKSGDDGCFAAPLYILYCNIYAFRQVLRTKLHSEVWQEKCGQRALQ